MEFTYSYGCVSDFKKSNAPLSMCNHIITFQFIEPLQDLQGTLPVLPSLKKPFISHPRHRYISPYTGSLIPGLECLREGSEAEWSTRASHVEVTVLEYDGTLNVSPYLLVVTYLSGLQVNVTRVIVSMS